MTLTVYGIPSCGTVKKARAWLTGARHAHTFVDLRDTPPTAAQISAWIARFGTKAMRNTSGGSYRALGEIKDRWTDAEWNAAFTQDPMLLKRPIVERDGQPVIVGWTLDDAEIAMRLRG